MAGLAAAHTCADGWRRRRLASDRVPPLGGPCDDAAASDAVVARRMDPAGPVDA